MQAEKTSQQSLMMHYGLIEMSHYMIVFGKHIHPPMELQYKTMWAIKKLNFDFQAIKEKRF